MIEDVRMEASDNGGFIVCYTEKTKPVGNSSELCNHIYNYKKESFGPDDEMAALARFKELSGKGKDSGGQKLEVEVSVKPE